MGFRDAKPVRFTPRGLTDAFDSTDAFAGACTALSNLIFDEANPEIVVSRPGVTRLTNFGSFTTPGFISIQSSLGTRIFGMIASGRNAGKDEPFCFDTATGAFVTVSGITNANTPTSPSPTGAWTPPTMAMIGTKLVVTHPGYPIGGNKFGWFDLSNPAAPAWSAGDTATNALPSSPTAVANYNNRAVYAIGNVSYLSDVLDAVTRTNATYTITHGDSTPIIGYCGLPIQTTSAGVLAALTVFKASQIWQVTGDPATSNLANNYLSLTNGCAAPRSIVQTPVGIIFSAVDGPWIIDLLGSLHGLTFSPQKTDQDVQVPFQNATQPSRIAASFSGNIYRACLATTVNGSSFTGDYWFHQHRRRWTGPHTWTYDCASQVGNFFVLSGNDNPAALFQSNSLDLGSLTYTDNGSAIVSHLTSSTFPKDGKMTEKQVVESTQELSSAGSVTSYQITGMDDTGAILASASIVVNAGTPLWGAVIWGAFNWASSVNRPQVYRIPWPNALVFQKMSLDIMVTAGTPVAIGTHYSRVQDLGYTGQSVNTS